MKTGAVLIPRAGWLAAALAAAALALALVAGWALTAIGPPVDATAAPGTLGAGSAALVAAAKVNALIAEGEWWRVVTAAWVHADAGHLAVNALWACVFALVASRWVGVAWTITVWTACGAAGQLASFTVDAGPSVGASGAVYGLAILLAIQIWRDRERIDPELRQRALPAAVAFVLALLVAPFMTPGVDHAAHVGGLALGALLALPRRGSRLRLGVMITVGALTLAAWGAYTLTLTEG